MKQTEIAENYVKLLPIIGDIYKEAPYYFSLGEDSRHYESFANTSQAEFQKSLYEIQEQNGAAWSISGYLENRAAILRNFPQMVREGRFYHLGIDINIPCGSPLFAPMDCEAVTCKYEQGEGNYGGLAILKCEKAGQAFYMLLGHLNPDSLPVQGAYLKKGKAFAKLGDMNQNGNWYHHTHLQILTQKALKEGWADKGYCAKQDLAAIEEYCPNPLLFL